jgi:hypothetical protein
MSQPDPHFPAQLNSEVRHPPQAHGICPPPPAAGQFRLRAASEWLLQRETARHGDAALMARLARLSLLGSLCSVLAPTPALVRLYFPL